MNFQSQALSFDQQLGNLLAMIVFFEKRLQEIRKKLAGNEQFHSQLAYQKLDIKKSSQAKAEDILYFLSEYERIRLNGTTIQQVQQFCRKYTTNGFLTYFEFLKLVTPKTNKSLAQRMMVRSPKRGVQMPQYLVGCFRELLETYVKMSHITQTIRKRIQSSASLNHLQMVQFFSKCLNSNAKILNFINITAGSSQFYMQDIDFLSCHLRSGNKVDQLEDEDIKELVCPLDMNFQKPQARQYRTQIGFHRQVGHANLQNVQTMNFLNKNYQKTQPDMLFNPRKDNFISVKNQEEKLFIIPQNNNQQDSQRNSDFQGNRKNMHHEQMKEPLTSNRMYIDKFVKPSEGIELDAYLNRNPNFIIGQNYQKFDDNLPQSGISSSRSSAFVQYGHY